LLPTVMIQFVQFVDGNMLLPCFHAYTSMVVAVLPNSIAAKPKAANMAIGL
jgi:hypothetical protein